MKTSSFRRSFPITLLAAASLWLGCGTPALAYLDVFNKEHEELDYGNTRPDFRMGRLQGYKDYSIRMGIARYANRTYYAWTDQESQIRVGPAGIEGDRNVPSYNYAEHCAVSIPGHVPQSQLYVVDLIPRGEYLWVIFRDKVDICAQALKPQDGTLRLMPVGKLARIRSQEALSVATASNGDAGIYVNVIYRPANPAGNLSLRSYLLTGANADFEEAGTYTQIPTEARADQASAFDAASTHEFNADGKLEEVHYVVWAAENGHIWLARYRPPSGGQPATYTAAYTNVTQWSPTSECAVLSLVEGGMKGDGIQDYSLSLIEFAASPQIDHVTMLRHYSLSTKTHGLSGGWTGADIKFEDDNNHHVAPASTLHWGVDKTRVVLDRKDDGSTAFDSGPSSTKFIKGMQQLFRFAVVGTYNYGRYSDSEKYTSFHMGEVKGNLIQTLVTPAAPHGITSLDTVTATNAVANVPMLSAWSVIGVVHGVPPYIPAEAGQKFPTLKFAFTKTDTQSLVLVDSTEDSSELSIGATLNGKFAPGIPGASGVCSVDTSYTYGIKTVNGTTSSTTTTRSVGTTQTFEPDQKAYSAYGPGEIGTVLYSAPMYVSKGYQVKRWNDTDFTDDRALYVTVVGARKVVTFDYLLESPELGPLIKTNAAGQIVPDVDYAALTEGIDPVPRTSALDKWLGKTNVKDFDSYEEFDSKEATFTASKTSAASVTFSYTKTDSSGKTQSLTKTNKGTVKVSGGIKDLFSINFSSTTSSSRTLSTTSTTTTSIGESITCDYPKLWGSQKVLSITTTAYLIYSANDKTPGWTPDLLKSGSSPFLLTWELNGTLPPQFGRKPWKLHGH